VTEASVSLDLPEEGLLARIVRLNMAVSQAFEAIIGEAGINLADYLVLAVVRRSPGQRSAPTAICEVLGRTTGGMTLTLDRLEQAGWLKRIHNPSDRRRVVVSLTPARMRLARRVNEALHEWEQHLELPSDPDALHRVLDVLTTAVSGRGVPHAASRNVLGRS
jgi:DNA-binding MarR family transcriptional regulator